jgi:hypothetical protein
VAQPAWSSAAHHQILLPAMASFGPRLTQGGRTASAPLSPTACIDLSPPDLVTDHAAHHFRLPTSVVSPILIPLSPPDRVTNCTAHHFALPTCAVSPHPYPLPQLIDEAKKSFSSLFPISPLLQLYSPALHPPPRCCRASHRRSHRL